MGYVGIPADSKRGSGKVLILTACKYVHRAREIHVLDLSPDLLLDSGDPCLGAAETERQCFYFAMAKVR